MAQWSQKSQERLNTCHSDLQLLASEVLSIHDCSVVYGHRTEADQNRLFDEGKSKKRWPNSKHNSWPSNAMDLAPYVPGVGLWDYEYVLYFSGLVLGTADMMHKMGSMQHKIRAGMNWSTIRDRNFKLNSFFDGNHYELMNV